MKIIIILALLTLSAWSCSKNGIVPAQEFGFVSGRIVPAGIFSHVYATAKSGDKLETLVSANTGNFKFFNLLLRQYTIVPPYDPHFKKLDDLTISVTSGKNNDLGILNFELAPQSACAISGRLLPIGFGDRITATDLSTGKQ